MQHTQRSSAANAQSILGVAVGRRFSADSKHMEVYAKA